MTVTPQPIDRIYAYHDPRALLEDFDASVAAIKTVKSLTAEQLGVLAATRASIEASDPSQALALLAGDGGDIALFGLVTLFAMDAGTSLSGPAEAAVLQLRRTAPRSIADLGWPAEALIEDALDDAAEWDPADLAAWQEATTAFRETHRVVPLKNYTVIGYWSGDEVVVAGIVEGVHAVFGGSDETGDGLFADSFSIPVDSPDVEAALLAELAAQYYDAPVQSPGFSLSPAQLPSGQEPPETE